MVTVIIMIRRKQKKKKQNIAKRFQRITGLKAFQTYC